MCVMAVLNVFTLASRVTLGMAKTVCQSVGLQTIAMDSHEIWYKAFIVPKDES